MRSILEKVSDPKAFGAEILKLAQQLRPDGKTKVSVFLDRLQDYTKSEITLDNAGNVISVLLDIGDQLVIPGDQSSDLIGGGNDVQIGRVNWQLLKRLNTEQRFKILRSAFEKGHALFLMQRATIVLGQQQGLYGETARPESEWFVTREQLSGLESTLLSKIREACDTPQFLQTHGLPFILNWWREKGSVDEVATWVSREAAEDSALATLLEGYLQSGSSISFGSGVSRRFDRLDPNWLKPYLDVDQTAKRVETLSRSSSLSPRQKRAVDQFLKEYEMRKQGKDPDDPFLQGS